MREGVREKESESFMYIISLQDHFKGKSKELKKIFDCLIREIDSFGRVYVDVVKSAINLGTKYHFAMLYIRKDSIKVEFELDRIIKDVRISKVNKITSHKYLHYVILKEKDDIDKPLIDWLRKAYLLKV